MPFKNGRANPGLGIPPMLGTPSGTPDVIAVVPVGTVHTFEDEVQGEGEFIYLPGAANVAQGDAVVYDLASGGSVTRLANNAQNNTGRPVAFAATALGAGTFGWYQIRGLTLVSAVAGTNAGVMMATATAGSVGNTADAGDQILNARISTAVGTPAANKAYATINRPFVQGQIT